jgi:hypothetical protein
MKLLTRQQQRQLLTNGHWNAIRRLQGREAEDLRPVVKLFSPWSPAAWLLSEIDPADEDRAFGLCDLGTGCPDFRHVRLSEIAALRGPRGLRVQRDLRFRPSRTLHAYADAARRHGHIVT